MLRFASLGSGSKGNATLVECGNTRVLVDCGFGLGDTEKRLLRLGCEPASITAILVTHEHGDHANGVGKLSRKYHIPVHTSYGTYHNMRDREFHRFESLDIHQSFTLNDLHINPFPVPHDAAETCQFTFSDGQYRLGLLTDAGSFTPHILNQLQQLDALLLECNYDEQMLMRGAYPPSLKKRVGGDYGHLDNHQATRILQKIDQQKLQHVIGMHLSENNNLPEHASEALCKGLGCTEDEISLACQRDGFSWRTLK